MHSFLNFISAKIPELSTMWINNICFYGFIQIEDIDIFHIVVQRKVCMEGTRLLDWSLAAP